MLLRRFLHCQHKYVHTNMFRARVPIAAHLRYLCYIVVYADVCVVCTMRS